MIAFTYYFVGMSAVFYTLDGHRIDVKYRLDYTLVSLIVVIILCYVGIHICATDVAFTMDKFDTIDEFVRIASDMTIKEIKNMKSKKYVLFLALFQSIHKLVLGGTITALGVCVMHYLGN
jgi:NO-binding membrane sensor protein with MHYT domain